MALVARHRHASSSQRKLTVCGTASHGPAPAPPPPSTPIDGCSHQPCQVTITASAEPTATTLALVAVATVAGFVDAIAGGGGLLTLPALLTAGLPSHLALGTNKGQSVFGSGAATLRFWRAGALERRRSLTSFATGFAGSLTGAALVDGLAALLNNGMAVYEMGGAATPMEAAVIDWMARTLGLPAGAGGVLTSGGSAGNLTALLAARQARAGFDVWTEGAHAGPPLAVLVAATAHYSIGRAVRALGWGDGGAIAVAVDDRHRMRPDDLPRALAAAAAAETATMNGVSHAVDVAVSRTAIAATSTGTSAAAARANQ